MHLVEIPSFFPPYGGEFCLEQSKALHALGHEVRIVSNVQLSVKRDVRAFLFLPYGRRFTTLDGIPLYQSYMRGIPKVIRPNVERWVSIVRSMFDTYVSNYGMPDVLHAHCAKWAGYAAMLISDDYHIPYVITEHLPSMIFREEFGDKGKQAWQVPLLREAYEKATQVVTVSEEVVDDLAPFFGKDYLWTAISNVIDVDYFAYRKRIPVKQRPFRFCCIGNYIHRKGYDILFRAFQLLEAVVPEIELHIAGQGTDSRECRDALVHLSCASKVVCYGVVSRDRVREMLYESDALVLATRDETQGLVLLEAMSTGIPVVTTEAVPQSVRIEGGCNVVPVDDAETMATVMKQILEQHEGYEGEEVSRKVAELAAPQVIARQLEQVFRKSLTSYSKREE